MRGAALTRCVFNEKYSGRAYVEYISAKYPKWQLAFTNKGLPKDPSKTTTGSRAAQFLSRPVNDKDAVEALQKNSKTRRRRRLTALRQRSREAGHQEGRLRSHEEGER